MSSDDVLDKNDIKLHSTRHESLTSFPNLLIDQTEKNCSRAQEEERSSSGSSPSTLKKRLQRLPATARSVDRASLGHRISRSREVSHRSDSARAYVDLNDDKEERNQIIIDPDESSSIASSVRSQGARARRRAKIRSEILVEIDKSLAETRSSLNDFFNLVDLSDEERKSTGRSVTDSIESLDSNRIEDSKDFSIIRCHPGIVTTGSLTSRSYYRDDSNEKERDRVSRQAKSAKEDRNSYDYQDNVKSNNRLSKNRIELHPISPLPPSNVHPVKFGGYRPQTGIILNNLSSGSESECLNDASNYVPRKIESPIVNTELSTPVSNVRPSEEGIKTLPVLSARNDDSRALSSFRSFQGTPESRIPSSRDNDNDNDNVDRYFEENPSVVEDIRENDARSDRSTMSKALIMDEEAADKKSLEINSDNEARANSHDLPDEIIRLLRKKSSRSIDDLSTLSKRYKEQHHSYPCSAKYTPERENFVSTTRADSEDRSSGRTSNDNQKDKMPSFMNVKLIEDLEGFDTSDNERQDNIAKVPTLPLNSEDVSRSTSADSKRYYTQNRSVDRSELTTALSNVTSSAMDKQSSRLQHRSYDDNKKVETFKSESTDKISTLSRRYQAPSSIESRNRRESYEEEVDGTGQRSRRAFSAPCPKLPNECENVTTVDMREDESGMPSNPQTYTHDQVRCQSADLSRQTFYTKQYFGQLSDSSSHFAQSTGSLSYVEDYPTLCDSLEMTYPRDEDFNSHTFDYVMPCIYPRQSHLSVLQEESETRLEENSRSESVVDSRERGNANNVDANEKSSTASSKNQSVDNVEGKRTSELSEIKDEGDDEESKDVDQNYRINDEDDDTSSKNSSLTSLEESQTESSSSSSQNSKSNYQRDNTNWSKEDGRTKNGHEEGDNEFQLDKSYDEVIDTSEYCSEQMDNNNSNYPEGLNLKDTRLKNNESTTLQFITGVQPETTMFVIQKIHEMCTVPPKASCSTSRLHRTSERTKVSPGSKNKKSQDRFPFTISETRSMISTSFKKQSYGENVGNQTRSLETFQNFAHPFFKEFLKTPAETVDCFSYSEQRQEQRNLVPRMKGLVRRFSKKLKISRKRNDMDGTMMDDAPTRVIYQNRECQVESMPDTGSDDSSIKESEWVVPKSPNTRSSVISSGKSLKKSVSLENLTLCSEFPRRRYDRDDLWVKELQERIPGPRDRARTSSKERFSVFASKSSTSSLQDDSKRSWRTFERKDGSSCRKEELIKMSTSSSPLASNVIESKAESKDQKNPNAEEASTGIESGCVCFKLFQMLTCSLFARSHGDSLIESKRRSRKKNKRGSSSRRKG